MVVEGWGGSEVRVVNRDSRNRRTRRHRERTQGGFSGIAWLRPDSLWFQGDEEQEGFLVLISQIVNQMD